MSTIIQLPGGAGLRTVSSRLEVFDVSVFPIGIVFRGEDIFTDVSSLARAASESIRQVAQFDASQLTTGLYPYQLTTVFHAPGSPIDGREFIVTGSVLVNNQQHSPFGAGWMLEGTARLVLLTDQRILLVEGDGSTKLFVPLGDGFYASPAGDFSSLVQHPDSSYTRTLKNGITIDFDAEGRPRQILLIAMGTRRGTHTALRVFSSRSLIPLA